MNAAGVGSGSKFDALDAENYLVGRQDPTE